MKKLKWVITAGLFLCFIAGMIYAQTDTQQTTLPHKTDSISLGKNLIPKDKQDAQNDLYVRMITATVLVIVLGAAAIFLSKKVLPKLTSPQGKQILLIETVHIAPRKSVHLIEVGNQRILIGTTGEHITKLADINEITPKLSDQDTNNS